MSVVVGLKIYFRLYQFQIDVYILHQTFPPVSIIHGATIDPQNISKIDVNRGSEVVEHDKSSVEKCKELEGDCLPLRVNQASQ